MKYLLVSLLAIPLLPVNALAQVNGTLDANASALGTAANNQTNSSSSTSLGGDNISIQNNNTFDSDPARQSMSTTQVTCSGPTIRTGIFATPWNNFNTFERNNGPTNSWDMAGGIGIVIPFGSSYDSCNAISQNLAEQARFNTALGIATACTKASKELDLKTINFSKPEFEPLKVCKDFMIAEQ